MSGEVPVWVRLAVGWVLALACVPLLVLLPETVPAVWAGAGAGVVVAWVAGPVGRWVLSRRSTPRR